MNIEKIKQISEATSEIVTRQSVFDSLQLKIDKLANPDEKFTSNMELQFNGSKYSFRSNLTAEEIIPVLKRKLKDELEILEKFKQIYEDIK